jgi:Ca-activated chloride channel family protein
MNVSGMVARVQVSQRFVNPTSEWREGVYVFPLSEKAAVDHLTMHIGARVIEGQIRERIEARRTYDNANAEGRKATLIEQERPNLFTTSVANIGPNEEIVVALEYEETLRYDDGSFRLRFPLAITPRYIPGAQVASGGGWSSAVEQVLDAERITPPIANPRDGYVNPVTIAIDLNAGFPLAKVASAYHTMNVEEHPGNRYRLTLGNGPVPANRDFELQWTPDVGSTPGAALFTETKGDKTYALLMALPPSTTDATTLRVPREITYIIDTSGSMEGVSIVQARDALLLALARLQAGDRFNVIEFNSTATPLFSAPMPLDVVTLRQATTFVSGLRARGGTEMLPALRVALAGERESSMMRQVVFLTDGAVGNEDAILRLLHDQLGDRRLFTIGIGPAPNTFFLTKAAQFGRGSFTFIGDVREVKEKMTALFRKLESPAMTDIAIEWPGAADAWPRLAPDLYAGEPVVVTAQFPANTLPGTVAIRGKRGDATWSATLPFSGGANEPGVAVLWARAKIDALMDAGRQGLPEVDVRDAVLDIALTHHLVSKYTSLVAVDVTPTRPGGVDAIKTALPGNVPQGLTGFGQLPRTATPAMLSIVIGLFLLLVAAVIAALRRRDRLQRI